MAQNGDSEESKFKLRSYQEEMLEASLKGNVIVKMDTGSGKTAIAISRAEAALQSSPPEKVVWLLCPTVVLCTQHLQSFTQRLPGYQSRTLIGSDGIDRWSNQKIWDAALKNMRIVISTYSVLNDCLSNGFVKVERLALLIFDEVHNCIRDNPGALLMRSHYRAAKQKPAILGLSASIVNPVDFEERFDAKVITPRRCRTELLHHANRPVLKYLNYEANEHHRTYRLGVLEGIREGYDRQRDPYVKGLDEAERQVFLLEDKPTICEKEIRAIAQKAEHVFEQLGPFMADYFILNTITAMLKKLEHHQGANDECSMTQAEAAHLSTFLRVVLADDAVAPKKRKRCDVECEMFGCPHIDISPKAKALIDFLEKESSPTFTGLIFVQQRALAYALAHLLSIWPCTKTKFRVAGFVGTSKIADPTKRLIEQVLPQDHKNILEKFRRSEREINLIVSTEVLGEGVDVPQCHLVLCFDPPPRIISFVQKRGRARMKDAKYVLMFENGNDASKIKKWQQVEKDLDVAYQQEERAWRRSMQLEEQEEPDADAREFRVKATGALLNHHNAVQRLCHLCQSVQSQVWIDARPSFSYQEAGSMITAKVQLPMSFPPELRSASSTRAWLTEKVAKRDAAYEMLLRLYQHGLLNDHLLPLKEEKELPKREEVTKERPASLADVLPTINPWTEVAIAANTEVWHPLQITARRNDDADNSMQITILLPVPSISIPDFTLFWSAKVQYTIHGTPGEARLLSKDDIWYLRSFTEYVLRAASGARMVAGVTDFTFLVELSPAEHQFWKDESARNVLKALIRPQYSQHGDLRPGIVWHKERALDGKSDKDKRYLFQCFTTLSNQHDGSEAQAIQVGKFPKRRDFLHPFVGNSDTYTQRHVLPIEQCHFEMVTATATQVSFFLPSILRRIELGFIMQKLHREVVPHLNMEALPHLQTAITTREAREAENYERLEFLGDAYINFLTSLNLMVEQPLWPEGYLTEEKGRRISNDTFCEAAIRVGLDQYIISKAFTGQKWTPQYIHKLAPREQGHAVDDMEVVRYQSSKKRVADVVEASIAVAYLDGGHDSAIELCKTYFPARIWTSPEVQAMHLAEKSDVEEVHLETLENLIGYRFKRTSLLQEAITSGSYKDGGNARSYERLEFLGDAILDYLVVEHIYNFKGRELPHFAMHSIKTAAVNAWILGYLCMNHFVLEDHQIVDMRTPSDGGSPVPVVVDEPVKKHIWQFIRPGARNERQLQSLDKFEQESDEIRRHLEGWSKYPWTLLCQFNPAKMFSDVIESILGAIYVDSHASNAACNAFLTRIGLYKLLDRMMVDNVACMHPKELLGIAADRRKVEYVYGEDEDRMVTCKVLIEGKQRGKAAVGETREIAGTVAAERAVSLEMHGKSYDMIEKVWMDVNDPPLEQEAANDLELDEDGSMKADEDDEDDEIDLLVESKKYWKPTSHEGLLFG